MVEDCDEFIQAVRGILDRGSDDGRAAVRHAFAVANSCRDVGDRILGLLAAAGNGAAP